jgi:hypothetical protein
MDSMDELLAALPLGDVGGAGPLSQTTHGFDLASALAHLARIGGMSAIDDADGCVEAVRGGLYDGTVIETCAAIAALSEGVYASAAALEDCSLPETTLLSSVGVTIASLLLDTAVECAGAAGLIDPDLPSENEMACLESVARLLCSSALDCREGMADVGVHAGERAAVVGYHAVEMVLSGPPTGDVLLCGVLYCAACVCVSLSLCVCVWRQHYPLWKEAWSCVVAIHVGAFLFLSGRDECTSGTAGTEARADGVLDVVGWAVHCCYSVILGGGGVASLLSQSATLGLGAAAAFLSAVPDATDDEQAQLAEAATTALRLTAVVLREDAVSGGHLTVAQLRDIGQKAAQLPVPPLPLLDPPCEFELIMDTICSASRARITCAQFLARR